MKGFNVSKDYNGSNVCATCLHNTKRDSKCRCDVSNSYITYSENFTHRCKEWIPKKKWRDYYSSEEEMDDMICEDAEVKAIKDTHFANIPKGVIQFALKQLLMDEEVEE